MRLRHQKQIVWLHIVQRCQVSIKKVKRIIITVDSSYEVEDEKNTVVIRLDFNKKKIVGQSMRTYLSEELYPSIHAKVEELLANTSLWLKESDDDVF